MLDLLWSDPQLKPGCTVNSYRGGGCYFGPDVTKKVLERHGLKLIVRSHECCIEGHDSTHNDKVIIEPCFITYHAYLFNFVYHYRRNN